MHSKCLKLKYMVSNIEILRNIEIRMLEIRNGFL